MKRILFSVICLLVLGVPAFSEIGLSLDLGTGMRFDKSEFTPSTKATFFLNESASEALNFDLRLGFNGAWTAGLDVPEADPIHPLLYLSIDSLALSGETYSSESGDGFSYRVGRFAHSEPSGRVFSGTLDGFSLGFETGAVTTGITLGYTGLVFKNASGIMMSYADLLRAGDSTKILGSPRVIGAVRMALPPLANQSITLHALIQEDLTALTDGQAPESAIRNEDGSLITEGDPVQSFKGGSLNTFYAGLGVRGPILPTLYYNAGMVYGGGSVLSNNGQDVYKNAALHSLGLYGRLSFFTPQFLSGAYNLVVSYASGDADTESVWGVNGTGSASQFTPVAGPSFGMVFSPAFSNLLVIQLDGGIKPFQNLRFLGSDKLQMQLKLFGFIRPTLGAVSETDIVVGDGHNYLGTEADLMINYRPFSDLGISLGTGLFFGNTESFVVDGEGAVVSAVRAALRLDVSFTM